MSYTNLLTIGAFSKLMQVTVKTLRHYEQKGLLIPAEVDEWTGYRYYSIGQMQRLSGIRSLQRLGFSLEEIKDLYDGLSHDPEPHQLDRKIQEAEAEIRRLTERRDRLAAWRNALQKIQSMEQFSIQSLPQIIVASHRAILPGYEALGELCCQKIGPEMQRLGCKCPPPGYCFTIERSREYSPTQLDIEYCEQVEEAGTDSAIIQFKVLPAVPTTICMKHYGPYERFHESRALLLRHIEAQGYRVVGDARYNYVDGIWNRENPEEWLTIIQVPVEQALQVDGPTPMQ